MALVRKISICISVSCLSRGRSTRFQGFTWRGVAEGGMAQRRPKGCSKDVQRMFRPERKRAEIAIEAAPL